MIELFVETRNEHREDVSETCRDEYWHVKYDIIKNVHSLKDRWDEKVLIRDMRLHNGDK
jgi:hypothetical protein